MFHPFMREVTSILRFDTDLSQRLPFTQNVIRLFVMSSLFCTTTRTQTGLYSSHS